MPRVSSETITLRPTERKKRERATTENAGRGDFEREREREREIGKSILEEIREKRVVCAVGERETFRSRKKG